MTTIVSVTPRVTKQRKINRQEEIPAIVYGGKSTPTPVVVERKTFEKIFKVAGESTVLTLEGLPKPVDVLVKDVAFAPLKGGISHVDFYIVDAAKELTTHVPLHFVGEAGASKSGAIINKVLHEVTVTCLASKLPAHLEVDLTLLKEAGDHITVEQIVLPPGVKIDTPAQETVAVSEAPRVKVEEPVAAVPMDEIEVEQKGKAEEVETN